MERNDGGWAVSKEGLRLLFISLAHPGQELAKPDYSTEQACGMITRSRCDGDERVIGPKLPNYIREPAVW